MRAMINRAWNRAAICASRISTFIAGAGAAAMRKQRSLVRRTVFVLVVSVFCAGVHSRAEFFAPKDFPPCVGAPNFDVPRLFPTVAAPGKFLSEDFNGDGLKDLVFLDPFSRSSRLTLSLGVNGPIGGFTAPVSIAPELDFPTSSPAFGAGDFNEDGKLDLVLAGGGSDSMVTLLAGDGAGGFMPSTTSPTPTFISALRAGDLNNDGHADLVTLSRIGQQIAVLIGTGAGGFGAPNLLTLPSGLSTPDEIWLTDVNDDGKLDIAYTALGNLFILRGNGGGGFDLI